MAATETPPQAEAPQPDEVRLLSDTPVEGDDQDALGLGVLAEALAELIDSDRTDTPLTIAISAPWGAGKTSTARLIERRLRQWSAQRRGARPAIICQFNAWLHSDAPHLGAALAASVARTVDQHRPWWRRVFSPLPTSMLGPGARRRRLIAIAVLALVVTAGAMFISPIRHLVTGTSGSGLSDDDAARVGPVAVLATAVALLWRRLFSAAQAAARFIERPAEEASLGSMATVRAQLGDLIGQAIGDGRLVIFIDDLERCQAERALEACEVATQLLAQESVVIVLIADMASIAKSAGTRYGGEDDDAGRRYLEKLIQIQITLPPPRPEDLEALLARRPGPAVAAAMADPGPSRSWSLLRLGFKPIAVVFGAGLAFSTVGEYAATGLNDWLWSVGGLLIIASAFLAVLSVVSRAVARLRTIHRIEAISLTIEKVKHEGDAEDLEASVLEKVAPGASSRDAAQVPELVRQQVRSYLIHESDSLKDVEAFIRLYPPRLPRGAKRMLNHARVLTRVATDRGVLSGDEVTPEHLGKWIVFSERWIELADRVKEEPSEMAELEAAARENRLEQVLIEWALDPVPSQRQLAVLLQREPELGVVVERLIRFEPAHG